MEAFRPPARGRAVASLGETICVLLRSRRAEQEASKTQVAILLHCAGPEVHDIYSNVVFANNDDDRDTHWEHVLTIVNQEKKKCLKGTDSTNVINARGRLLTSESTNYGYYCPVVTMKNRKRPI